ncbi:MAG: hypothetical protein CL909_01380 [Deltaproteobacteria bacterium]|nr:hypothetical protein [Deltaproteobacteria bacterium]
MQRQNISKNTKASLLKRLRFSFLIPLMMIFWSAILGSTSASAQKLTAENIACNVSAQARYECYIKGKKDSQAIAEKHRSALNSQKKLRQSLYFKKLNETLVKTKAIAGSRLSTLDSQKKIRQEAYFKFKERMGSLENAKAIAITRKSILEEQEKLRLELNESPKKQRKKINRQEIMQQVEYSRSRNISHKGEKYSITYGYVLEPRP